jgi:hypothetical protein
MNFSLEERKNENSKRNIENAGKDHRYIRAWEMEEDR